MKALMMTVLAGALAFTAIPTLAGRDETLIRQIDKTVAAKRATQMELAKQQQQHAQTGLAGAAGKPGKMGPTTDERQLGRAARRFPGDHP